MDALNQILLQEETEGTEGLCAWLRFTSMIPMALDPGKVAWDILRFLRFLL
jgi:hypothetical protein